jgi:hypothetical protein
MILRDASATNEGYEIFAELTAEAGRANREL